MMRRLATILALLLLLPAVSALAVESRAPAPAEEVRQFGERLYRAGLLPSGEPLRAVVHGDIEVDGVMFSCESCHLRSGIGTTEGTVISPPVTGRFLYQPLAQFAEEIVPHRQRLPRIFDSGLRRPAYDDRSLALAIWNGIDPGGRELNQAMPRYLLDPADMEILVAYLRQLSKDFSPGVDETTMHLATVVSTDLPAARRSAMFKVLQTYADLRSNDTRRQQQRATRGSIFERKMYSGYRRLQLHVWELQGERATWPAQLAEYYRKAPVFALIGGMVSGSWEPVHTFCESNRIPCLFPQTELPVISDRDWYTVYFSKGHYQQGEAAARHLRQEFDGAEPLPLVQLVRDEPAAKAVAAGFEQTWQRLGFVPPVTRLLAPGSSLAEELDKLPADWRQGTLLLWLGNDCYPELERRAQNGPLPRLYLAASLLGDAWRQMPDKVRSSALLAWPQRLPSETPRFAGVLRGWLKSYRIPEVDLAMQGNMYFAVSQFSSALMMLEDDFYRDYLLDSLDMSDDRSYNILTYPNTSFGPGQRYAAKGCYITRIGPGKEPRLEPLSEWVVH